MRIMILFHPELKANPVLFSETIQSCQAVILLDAMGGVFRQRIENSPRVN